VTTVATSRGFFVIGECPTSTRTPPESGSLLCERARRHSTAPPHIPHPLVERELKRLDLMETRTIPLSERCLKRHVAREIYAVLRDGGAANPDRCELRARRRATEIPIKRSRGQPRSPIPASPPLESGTHADPELEHRTRLALDQLSAPQAAGQRQERPRYWTHHPPMNRSKQSPESIKASASWLAREAEIGPERGWASQTPSGQPNRGDVLSGSPPNRT
jgi:hypothetical protein